MDFGTLGIFCGHGTIYDADVAVDDPYLLHTAAVVASGSLANVDAFNERPQQLRRQLRDFRVPAGLLNEDIHVGGGGFQLFQFHLLLRDGRCQLFLLGIVVGGQHSKLLVGDLAQHVVLVEPLEQDRQLRIPLHHFVQLPLGGGHLLAELCRVLAVDVSSELVLLCSREVRHPPQVIQYDSIQVGFRDMVSRAGILASLAVGGAAEVVLFRLHFPCAAQHHVPAAVSAVD